MRGSRKGASLRLPRPASGAVEAAVRVIGTASSLMNHLTSLSRVVMIVMMSAGLPHGRIAPFDSRPGLAHPHQVRVP